MGRTMKDLAIIVIAMIAVIYLINPTAGIIELIPDNLPIVGNLDEVAAVGILVNTLGYYGINMNQLYGRRKSKKDDQ